MSAQTGVVYLVLSEECYGKGIVGAFSTLELAVKFAETESERKNMEYVIYRTVLDNPASETQIVQACEEN